MRLHGFLCSCIDRLDRSADLIAPSHHNHTHTHTYLHIHSHTNTRHNQTGPGEGHRAVAEAVQGHAQRLGRGEDRAVRIPYEPVSCSCLVLPLSLNCRGSSAPESISLLTHSRAPGPLSPNKHSSVHLAVRGLVNAGAVEDAEAVAAEAEGKGMALADSTKVRDKEEGEE